LSVYEPTPRFGTRAGKVTAPLPSVWRDCQTAVLLSQLKLTVSFPPNPPAVTEIVPLTGADAGETVTAAGPVTPTLAVAETPPLAAPGEPPAGGAHGTPPPPDLRNGKGAGEATRAARVPRARGRPVAAGDLVPGDRDALTALETPGLGRDRRPRRAAARRNGQ